jgi:hypothetical protein
MVRKELEKLKLSFTEGNVDVDGCDVSLGFQKSLGFQSSLECDHFPGLKNQGTFVPLPR